MEIALNFHFLNEYWFLSGSWSLFRMKPPRLCYSDVIYQSMLVCQNRDTHRSKVRHVVQYFAEWKT